MKGMGMCIYACLFVGLCVDALHVGCRSIGRSRVRHQALTKVAPVTYARVSFIRSLYISIRIRVRHHTTDAHSSRLHRKSKLSVV